MFLETDRAGVDLYGKVRVVMGRYTCDSDGGGPALLVMDLWMAVALTSSFRKSSTSCKAYGRQVLRSTVHHLLLNDTLWADDKSVPVKSE